MFIEGKGYKYILGIVLGLLFCFLLSGCGDGGSGNVSSDFSVEVLGYELDFGGNVKLERVLLKNDDLDEIVDLFQEVGDDVGYRDSLLIAEKFANGLGASAFANDNLDTLQSQGLTLSNIQKTQIGLVKKGTRNNVVLVDYEITKGLVPDFPLLYVSQLFIPNDNDMILMSFITEDKSSHSSALNMFKNVK